MDENNLNEKNMLETRKKRNTIFGIVLVVVALIGIGYAYLQTTLSISGTTKVSQNSWSIYWDNIHVTDGSVTGVQVTTAPTLSNNDTSVSFSVNLKKPGEFYEFTLDVVNDGTIDAMIDDIDFDVDNGGDLPTYLDFSVTYEDDVPLVEKQILKSESTNENVETYKVRVEFKKNITSNDLVDDENGETVVCTVDISYVQADSTAIPRKTDVYSIDDTMFHLNSGIPNGADTYNTSATAKSEADAPIFLRHTMVGDKVKLISVGFEVNNVDYYLKAGERFYESNKKIMDEVFDECEEVRNEAAEGYGLSYFCRNNSYYAVAYELGVFGVFCEDENVDYGCAFRPVDGMAQCGDSTVFDNDWPLGS